MRLKAATQASNSTKDAERNASIADSIAVSRFQILQTFPVRTSVAASTIAASQYRKDTFREASMATSQTRKTQCKSAADGLQAASEFSMRTNDIE